MASSTKLIKTPKFSTNFSLLTSILYIFKLFMAISTSESVIFKEILSGAGKNILFKLKSIFSPPLYFLVLYFLLCTFFFVLSFII